MCSFRPGKRRSDYSLWAFLAAGLASSALAGDANWPDWRGPRLDRSSPATGVPVKWSASENIRWRTPLPSWAAATPIVWGDHVFVVTPSARTESEPAPVGRRLGRQGGRGDAGGSDLLLIALDRRDGSIRWKRPLDDRNTLFGKHNMASPSPVTDGRHVWALTGTGVLTAFNFEGEQVWRRNLSDEYVQFAPYWGYGSSPLLHDGRIIVQILHGAQTDGPSLVIALNAADGKTAWSIERKTDAQAECPDAYTTPTISRAGGRVDIVISGADYVTGHDPSDGRELWRAAGLNPEKQQNYRVCPSPVAHGDFLFCGSRKRPLLALRGGGTGDVTESHILWKYEGPAGPDVPTPVTDGKYFYMVEDKGIVTCLDVKTGETVWGPERTTLGTVSASPLLADGKLYITNENGVTTVLSAGGTFERLAENELDGSYTLASPVAAGSELFIRTGEAIYCIGE